MNVLRSSVLGIGGTGQLAGFRPEHVRLGDDGAEAGSIDAVVEVVEYLGDEQLAHLRLDEHELVVKLPVDPRLQVGDRQTFSVPLHKVLLFDEESKQAVGTAA
jgi:multiple sugar transport system ATP-binding protein